MAVARENHGAAFLITLGYDLKEVACLVADQRRVPDLIDDEQPRPQHVMAQYGVVALLSQIADSPARRSAF